MDPQTCQILIYYGHRRSPMILRACRAPKSSFEFMTHLHAETKPIIDLLLPPANKEYCRNSTQYTTVRPTILVLCKIRASRVLN